MTKRVLAVLAAALTLCVPALSQYATLTGTLSASNGLPASNYVITFTPSQFGYIGGSGVVVNTTTSCATSTDGSVVGLPNPLTQPVVTVGFTGTLPASNYYVKYGFYDASGNLTLVSPERVIQLNSTGQLIVASPTSGLPAGAVGMKVYISASPNTETLQGLTTGAAAFIQSIPLVTGAAPSTSNTTICKQIANDAIWPVGTGYTVALIDTGGNTLPGYPMMWQLMGPNTTINLSNGLPYYHGTVYFPTPILASPLNHGTQSISGNLNLSGYQLQGLGALGIGTNSPAWPLDVENGPINTNTGYILNGGSGVTTGQCLVAGSDAFHTFVPGTCFTPPTVTIFYQHVALQGTIQTQADQLNFLQRFTISNTSGVTSVGLNAPGSGNLVATYSANPGATTNCATFDGSGNVTPTGQPCYAASATLVDADWTETGTCAIGVGQPNHCDFNATLPVNMPDASYQIQCTANMLADTPAIACNIAQTTLPTTAGSSITVRIGQYQQNGTTGTTHPAVYMRVHHN